jgi:uncharacterized OB-fold protein
MSDESTSRLARPSPTAEVAPASGSVPFLLDFFPLEDARSTQVAAFFDALREGRFTTTRCPRDALWLWPPRVVCPTCHGADLPWVDLPRTGRLYAFSAVLAGAPMGMEDDVPFVVGLVDLDGVPLRLFGRVVGRPWTDCRVGLPVRVEPFEVPGGRVFYRFRADPDG